jgi:predicted metal-dependent enzyme (double-stranded beta helix superfamily)
MDPVTDPVTELVAAVDGVLARGEADDVAVELMRPAMEQLLARAHELPDPVCRSADGAAVGHLLHDDPDGRYHVITVVFPPGTSSGVHEHGCWGLIGYIAGLDEETKYQRTDGGDGPDGCELAEVARVLNEPGTISRLMPPDEMFHRVRNPGDVDGVSIHILCHGPETHPHRYWQRDERRLLPFPFKVLDGGMVRAEVAW